MKTRLSTCSKRLHGYYKKIKILPQFFKIPDKNELKYGISQLIQSRNLFSLKNK